MPKRAGRPSVAQTPAPKSDKIYGSKKNPKGSATEKKAKSIQLSDKTINTLKEKLDTFKKSHPSKKNITLSDLKAVYRRGSGAYSSSHRPTITGGAPNSRAAWSYARVNKFLKKAGGAKVKAAYVQDDDLFANGGVTKGGDCYEAAAQFCMGFMPEPVEFVGEPHLVHAEVKGQGKAEGIRFGHAWVEDDENVYDYSNGRRIVMPKVFYYAIGDIQTDNPLKYQRYTFPEARAKMLKTKHYGSWDIETEYADGGNISDMIKSVNLDKNIYEQNIEYHSIYPKINSKEYTIDSEQILKENFIQSFLKNVEIDSDNNITAYRLLALDDISDLDKDNLGIYWACSEDKVVIADDEGYEHEKKSYKNKYLIKVKANIKDINWQDTFELYVINDWMEGEIRFIKSTKPVETYYKKIGDTKWVKLKNEVLFADGGLMAREDYTKDALEFFKKELGIKSDVVLVQSQSSFDPMSMSQLMGSVTPKKDNKFYVAVNFNETKNRFIRVLAHELVHVKQMEDERLRFEGDKIIFDDEKMTYDEYQKRYYSDDIPKHEEEAFNLERVLQNKYAEKENSYSEGGLIAPNGKPSNLTAEQYKLVRTPEFKAWFGDWENDPQNASKVVDKNGEPLVLLRGNDVTNQNLGYVFQLGKNFLKKENVNNFGFFFTDEIGVAKRYADIDLISEVIEGTILSVFVKSNKILDLTDFGIKIWPEYFIDGLIEKGIKFDGFENLMEKIKNFDEASEKTWGNYVFDYFDVFPELRMLFIKNGFTSVIFLENSRYHNYYKVYVAFESNQIKLADGRNTTFDAANPDIRYADGGNVGYKVYVNDEYRRTITDENLKEYYLTKGFQMNDGKLQIYGQDISFEDGGLIAPNGKPSNLTAEQYKLVRTPEFKAWFGDWENDPENASKVVDKNGEPMVVYHGSRKKVFYEFKNYYQIKKKKLPTDRLELHFFSNNKDKVRYYGSNIYECFLNMKNPLYYATGDGVPEEAIFQKNKDGFIMESNISSILAVPNSQQIKLADGTNKTFDMNNPDIRFADGGQTSQLVTCINCSWQWETADSAEFDKYVCHQCGFDNSLFYDGGLLKPTMPLDQIAEKQGVSIEYLEEQLNKGLQHEKEHTDSDEVATSIALHHLAERPDYYEELEKMKLEHGGEVTISDEDYEFTIGGDENLGKAIKQDGVIVGGIAYDEDEQQIYGIVIKNKFRKKGVAKRAIKALFDKNPDLEGVYVRAVPESKGFWKKIGTDFENYNEDAGLWEGYVKRFEDGGDVDLFEEMDNLPEEVQAVLRKYSTEDETYTNAESMLSELEPLGYTFEYGLDAVPYNLTKIDISENNSPQDVEIADFLKQQKDEAQMVMTCDDSKIYKAMICKTKCEIADKRMSQTENAEELNAWNSYKNIWNECLESILNDDMDKYKVGGKTCGCGCGSIYSKGGMFSKGGLAYGNSHDKGGMPMKVKSTGQNIEIEGGEGVVNKRSMQSSKKVEFQGQKMTPCEAVSKINEMGGGVKFKCSDVKNIIAEDGQF